MVCRVPVGRAEEDQHQLPGPESGVADPEVVDDDAVGRLHRAVIAQQLLHRPGGQLRLVDQSVPGFRVA